MQSPISRISEATEISRLKSLLPFELRSQLTVVPNEVGRSAPIRAKKLAQKQFEILVDFHQWCFFTESQRDLLFWHEVARIQSRAVVRSSWELIAIGIGLSSALVDLTSHNLISFVVALSVSGFASYKLYQRKLGEQSLREATAADQTTIELAMQFGYSYPEAYDSLYEALRLLTRQPTQKSNWKKYQVRLRVLEMLSTQKADLAQPLMLDMNSIEHFERSSSRVQNPAF